jgi:glucosamine--fructose-6-phosphate aminotransferase (isomerizing)
MTVLGFVFSTIKKNFFLHKKVGKISDAENELLKLKVEGNIGIAHTRWATTGKVTLENAHPHFDCKKEIFWFTMESSKIIKS